MTKDMRRADPLVAVRDLRVQLPAVGGWTSVVDGVDLDLAAGRTLAVLGESGSGKSMTGRAIMGVLPPQARVSSGRVLLEGDDLLTAHPRERQQARGSRVAMVFQDAQSALNPVQSVGHQIAEGVRAHRSMGRAAARRMVWDALGRVGIPAPRTAAGRYPHQFSGGMRQRVMIAMALAMEPDVLIADEPTTALDATIQAQVIDLLMGLQEETAMGLMFITHDMGVVSAVADDVLVMYAGRVVEVGPAAAVLGSADHPYTSALLAAVPRREHRGRDLPAIPGQPPNPGEVGDRCAFADRCPHRAEICETDPPLIPVRSGQRSACHHPDHPDGPRRSAVIGARA